MSSDRLLSDRLLSDRDTFEAAVADFTEQYVTLVNEMGALASVLAPPTAALKACGALEVHLARHRTAATLMLDRLVPVRVAIADGAEAGDIRFDRAWATWLEYHGHRGVFESDIARPRFAEDPTSILSAARLTPRPPDRPTRARRRGAVDSPGRFGWRCGGRWQPEKRFAIVRCEALPPPRRRLLVLAEIAVDDGRLPSTEALWELTWKELVDADGGRVFDRNGIAQRKARREELGRQSLPDTVHRHDDLAVGRPESAPGDHFTGLSLTTGVVRGRALRAAEPPSELPPGFEPDSTILVARSVDAGWIPIFSQVAAVAVEIGGDLSHGSIVLRELGIPAVTNLGGLGGAIATGDLVEVRAGVGVLEVIERTPAAALDA